MRSHNDFEIMSWILLVNSSKLMLTLRLKCCCWTKVKSIQYHHETRARVRHRPQRPEWPNRGQVNLVMPVRYFWKSCLPRSPLHWLYTCRSDLNSRDHDQKYETGIQFKDWWCSTVLFKCCKIWTSEFRANRTQSFITLGLGSVMVEITPPPI